MPSLKICVLSYKIPREKKTKSLFTQKYLLKNSNMAPKSITIGDWEFHLYWKPTKIIESDDLKYLRVSGTAPIPMHCLETMHIRMHYSSYVCVFNYVRNEMWNKRTTKQDILIVTFIYIRKKFITNKIKSVRPMSIDHRSLYVYLYYAEVESSENFRLSPYANRAHNQVWWVVCESMNSQANK